MCGAYAIIEQPLIRSSSVTGVMFSIERIRSTDDELYYLILMIIKREFGPQEQFD